MQVSVVPISVRDQDAAKDFYVGTLDFTVLVDEAFGEGHRWLMLAPPGGGAALALATWNDRQPPGSTQGLMFEVPDVEATRSALAAKGIEFPEGIITMPWGRFIDVSDVDGNGLIFQTSTAPLP